MTFGFHRLGPATSAAVLVLGLAAAFASAQNTNGDAPPFRGGRGQGRGPGGPGGPGGPMGLLEPFRMMAPQLDLSDAQKAQITSLAQSHADEWKGLLDREAQARQAQQAAINATPFDEVLIRQRSAELAAADADAAVARARARGEFLQVLTTAQQATLKEMESRQGPPLRGAGGGRRGRN